MSKVVMHYIGDKKNKATVIDGVKTFHDGVIGVASIADFETGKVRVGLSFCSPSEPFLRWKGRNIATGRLKKNPIILSFKTKPIDAISKFLYGLVNDNREFCDHVESLPIKASKHFPIHFPWFRHFNLPAGILRIIEGGNGMKLPEELKIAN